jgi:hypothetical protein
VQIDFHFAATYAVARIAGFDDAQAHTIAYSAQYVDDSTTSGFLRFDNGMRFYRHATAHPPVDLANMDNDVGARSWLPFHFLPGNDGLETPAPQDERYWRRLVCRPDSPVAHAMMRDVVEASVKHGEHSLHRLGIAAHVFVDTFAHQGFVGERTRLNEVDDIRKASGDALEKMHVPPVGHGQVDTYPDRPFLHWQYLDSTGQLVDRNNPVDFVRAADRLCQEFQRYRAGDADVQVPGLGVAKLKVAALISGITDEDGDARCKRWLNALENDYFGFGTAAPVYVGKGQGSWKHVALGDDYLRWLSRAQASIDAASHEERSRWYRIGATVLSAGVHYIEAVAEHFDLEPFTYRLRDGFLASDYKRFHDAAEEQRFAVFKKILPRFGIFAA